MESLILRKLYPGNSLLEELRCLNTLGCMFAKSSAHPDWCRVDSCHLQVHAEENEEVVRSVLPEARDRGWELGEALPGWQRRGLPLFEGCEKLVRTDPVEDGTDGFFVALFCKRPLQ